MSIAVASRYARALADLVLSQKDGITPQEALQQVRAVEAVIDQSSELRGALMSPAVNAAKKRMVARRLAEQLGLAQVIRNFILVVIDHRRVTLLGRIADALEKTLDDRMGRLRATVSTAAPLEESQRKRIEERLEQRTGKDVVCDFKEDPELVGGVSVQIGSTIYDGSVRGRLAALRTRMASSG
jgi:F-type H+-transporting ATPase subunit delta